MNELNMISRGIVMWLITVFSIGVICAEIIASYSPPEKEGLVDFSLKKNIYRVSLAVFLLIGVLVVWMISKS